MSLPAGRGRCRVVAGLLLEGLLCGDDGGADGDGGFRDGDDDRGNDDERHGVAPVFWVRLRLGCVVACGPGPLPRAVSVVGEFLNDGADNDDGGDEKLDDEGDERHRFFSLAYPVGLCRCLWAGAVAVVGHLHAPRENKRDAVEDVGIKVLREYDHHVLLCLRCRDALGSYRFCAGSFPIQHRPCQCMKIEK